MYKELELERITAEDITEQRRTKNGTGGKPHCTGRVRKLLLIPGSRLERLKADETIPAKERASAALLCGELGE